MCIRFQNLTRDNYHSYTGKINMLVSVHAKSILFQK